MFAWGIFAEPYYNVLKNYPVIIKFFNKFTYISVQLLYIYALIIYDNQ